MPSFRARSTRKRSGTRSIFLPLESRRMLATHFLNGTSGDDYITVNYGDGVVYGSIAGQYYQIREADFDDLVIRGLGGNDDIYLYGCPNKPMRVEAGDGDDHIGINEYESYYDLARFRGQFTIDGGAGSDELIALEQEETRGQTYRFTQDSFTREGFFTMSYARLEGFHFQAGSYADTINIDGTAAGTGYVLRCGRENGFGAGLPGDRIFVGVLGGSLANLRGNLTIDGQGGGDGGPDVIDFRDTLNPTGGHYTLTPTTFTPGAGMPAINFSGIQTIQVAGSLGNDVIDVEGVATDAYVDLYGGSGDDTVRLAPTARRLADVAGILNVYGDEGRDTIKFFDQGSSGPRDYRVGGGYVSAPGHPDPGFDGFETVWLSANGAANTISVVRTEPGATVQLDPQGGGDTVVVGTEAGDPANVVFPGSTILRRLHVHTNGRATVDGVGAGVLKVVELQMEIGGSLDLSADDVLIWDWDGSSTTNPLARVRAMIASAYAGGTWAGAGMTTSTAGRAVGYADARELFGDAPPPYLGWAIDDTTTIVRATFAGDANLDGRVNLADFNRLAAGFGATGGASWTQGNFNYDGGVNLSDFNLLASNFGRGV